MDLTPSANSPFAEADPVGRVRSSMREGAFEPRPALGTMFPGGTVAIQASWAEDQRLSSMDSGGSCKVLVPAQISASSDLPRVVVVAYFAQDLLQ